MKMRHNVAGRGLSRKSRHQSLPNLERMEVRQLLTQFVVTDLSDSVTDTGSLRYAITQSNATTTSLPNSIVFSGLTGTGPFTLDPLSPLPTITQAVSIDGSTAPGFNTATNQPVFEINGSQQGNTGSGLAASASGVTINGLCIDAISGAGITLSGNGKDVVTGSYIGTDLTGTRNGNNTGVGIEVDSAGNTIGGTTAAARNVVSSWGEAINLAAAGGLNLVEGNYVGTNAAGTAALTGESVTPSIGINVSGSALNTIGGVTAAGNVVSGYGVGIEVQAAASGTGIFGNLIGTDYTGNTKIGNSVTGILLTGAGGTTIGGLTGLSTQLPGNVIAGSTQYGIELTGGSSGFFQIQSNKIGVGLDGMTAIGNGSNGVFDQGISNVVIGNAQQGVTDPNFTLEKSLGNIIANNGKTTPNQGAGVQVTGNVFDVGILSNSIYNNIGGITLGQSVFFGVTAPALDSAASGGGQTQVRGTLSEPNYPNQKIRVQIFSGTALRVAGREDGQNFIGEADVTTDLNGNASFTISLPTVTGVGDYITATATSNAFNAPQSSTFSAQAQVGLATVTDLFVNVATPTTAPFVGQNYAYTVTVGNAGPSAATGVTLSDTIPANATFVSATGGTFANGVLTDTIDNLSGAPSLAAVSTPPQAAPVVGQPYTYTVTVTNNDTNDATNVVLSDVIPSNSTFQSATVGTYTASSNTLVAALGSLAAGASTTVSITVLPTTTATLTDTPTVTGSGAATVTIVVKPNSVTGAFTNVATVTSSNVQDIDPNLNNNTVTTTYPGGVQPDAVLALSLVPAVNPTPVGQQQTYVLTLTNQGPSTINNGTVTITLPASFTSIGVTTDGTYSVSGSTITVSTGIVPSGGVNTTTFTATPTAVGQFNVTASVTSNLSNPDPGLASVTVPVTVANSSDLAIGITSNPNPVLLNQPLVYTLTVTNNGPSTSPSAVVTDVLPAGLTFDAAGSSDGNGGTITFANGTVTDTLTSLDSGATDTITIAVTPTTSGTITNTATVTDPTVIDPDTTNNSASATTLVNPADLSVTILNPNDPLFIGTNAAYQVQVANAGPADATNVIFTDVFGAGATIVSSSAGSVSGSTVTANLGTLASGATTTVTIIINPTVSGTITSTATVASDAFDPNSGNNTNSVTNTISPVALGVTVAGTPTSVLIGGQLSYVYTVSNGGPAAAAGVVLGLTLPTNITVTSETATGGQATFTTPTSVSLGTIQPGSSVTVTIIATANTAGAAGTVATVTTTNLNTTPTAASAAASVTVINTPGTINVGSPETIVTESSGTVTITLVRTSGTLGAVTVNYATSDYTALAGVNYVATTGTATFADGQTTATITIPIIDAHLFGGYDGFFVTLSSPGGGATLGAYNVTAVLIANTDRDTTPPAVTGFTYVPNPNASYINGFQVTFNKSMNPTLASLASNYTVFLSNHDAGKGNDTVVPLAAAVFNPSNNTVTLVPTRILPANSFYRIIINGTVTNALTDTSGNLLSGDSGQYSNYDIIYGVGTNLTYRDSRQNSVNIQISGGGKVEIIRAPNGDVATLNLLSIVPHKTKLSGSVKKLSKVASGYATIGMINGLGQFGYVNSTLTTPSFYVQTPPVLTATALADTSNPSAASTTAVTVARKTPKGPALN